MVKKSDPEGQVEGAREVSDAERARLGEIGHRLGRNVLGEVATTNMSTAAARAAA